MNIVRIPLLHIMVSPKKNACKNTERKLDLTEVVKLDSERRESKSIEGKDKANKDVRVTTPELVRRNVILRVFHSQAVYFYSSAATEQTVLTTENKFERFEFYVTVTVSHLTDCH
ncbi:hypothetical protein CDAR_509751 [Caerostris darwini]|uniref:Uncharacterized protein n=1 Tax=Caerostris darwini TaxID=1538125 RepID=A0AAV4N7E7_9ARAC|nr:hypothetical protein CDAR_509751 [Caerostris darwini]